MASRFPVPYSSSRDLRSFDPLLELHREMDRLFDDVLGGPRGLAGGTPTGAMSMPRIDVHEGEREVCISAELPGVKPSEVDVRVEGNVLTISGEKKTEADRKQEDYHVMERSYGRFRRTVQLPFAPDPQQVRAECDHGVLTIHMPKQAQLQRSRRIEVQAAGQEGERRAGAPARDESVPVQSGHGDGGTAKH
jgi:HSP20 family protein